VLAIAVGPDGTLWFGSGDELNDLPPGSGVSRYDPVSGAWQTFNKYDGLADNDVYAIAVGPDGALWFGTWGGGVSR
jgi:ligand-binding sensor domain-containing protein